MPGAPADPRRWRSRVVPGAPGRWRRPRSPAAAGFRRRRGGRAATSARAAASRPASSPSAPARSSSARCAGEFSSVRSQRRQGARLRDRDRWRSAPGGARPRPAPPSPRRVPDQAPRLHVRSAAIRPPPKLGADAEAAMPARFRRMPARGPSTFVARRRQLALSFPQLRRKKRGLGRQPAAILRCNSRASVSQICSPSRRYRGCLPRLFLQRLALRSQSRRP